MKGARLIVPNCTGFWTVYPEEGELKVQAIEHYRVKCLNQAGETMWIPLREFEILDFPRGPKAPKDRQKPLTSPKNKS